MAEKEEKKQKLAAEKAEKAKIKTEEAQKRKLQAEEKKRLKLEALEIQKQVDEEADRLRLEAEKLEAQKLAENPPIAAESVESQSASDNVQIAEATTSESLEKNGKKRKLYTEPVLSDATPKIDPEAQTAVFRDITGSEYLKLAGNEDVKPKRGRKAIASTSSDVETPKRAKRVKEASVDPEDAGKWSIMQIIKFFKLLKKNIF